MQRTEMPMVEGSIRGSTTTPHSPIQNGNSIVAGPKLSRALPFQHDGLHLALAHEQQGDDDRQEGRDIDQEAWPDAE